MVQIVCRYLRFFLRKKGANIGNLLKKGSDFEQRECKYAITCGGGGRARGHKTIQKHSFCIRFIFLTICFQLVFLFVRF